MKYSNIIGIALLGLLLTGCRDADIDEVTVPTVSETVIETVELSSNSFVQNYDISGKSEGEITFTITKRGISTLKDEYFIFPDTLTADTMVFELDNGDIEVMLYNIQAMPGKHILTLSGKEFNNGIELEVPITIVSSYHSDLVHMSCVPSTTIIKNGGMLTGLLNYDGEVAEYNLGNISVTLHGFTADIEVTKSSGSSHMLVLKNVVKTGESERTYFDICEGTAFDIEGNMCNGCEIDITIEG